MISPCCFFLYLLFPVDCALPMLASVIVCEHNTNASVFNFLFLHLRMLFLPSSTRHSLNIIQGISQVSLYHKACINNIPSLPPHTAFIVYSFTLFIYIEVIFTCHNLHYFIFYIYVLECNFHEIKNLI